ncbi:MAG: phosphotransferase [candidate division KSB1 bacterium]|nr:phosphotransferase [candidate division KSB1 bacterium]MDZ7294746.1 phosphotransferase [candidate division KSB1 bacterium]MDZ7384667.1 phosphotransferase [candidate division KSB1 bacterium]MDZ7393079.1 phosphotransferase [candidate division KSB1 bacterium]
MEQLARLFQKTYGHEPSSIVQLKGDGSDRHIFRLADEERTVIGIWSEDHALNVAFLEFSRHFARHGLRVPAIYAEDLSRGVYLEEDLGDWTLFDWMVALREKEGFSPRIVDMYRKVLEDLPLFQIVAGASIDYDLCHQHREFGEESMAWDLHYFRHRFLEVFYKGPLDFTKLEEDFRRLRVFLLEEPRKYFMYRDFQSRNIMVVEGKPYYIDYQSGRRGALQYDVASLLYDAKANVPETTRMELLAHYLDKVQQYEKVDPQRFVHYFYGFVLIRMMQAFGAYGYLSVVKGKKHFFKSVPFAIRNLEILLEKDLPILAQLPELRKVCEGLVSDPELRGM